MRDGAVGRRDEPVGQPVRRDQERRNRQAQSATMEKARTTGSPTPRERAYIAAVAALFTTPRPRRSAIASSPTSAAWRGRRENPQDVEAAIFHALAVNQTALPTDKTYAAQLRAVAILEPLYAKYPEHPGLAHYIIHAYDHPPLAARALPAARRYAEIAPSAPHALHMPSHTFTRVGAWQESVATNRRSEETALSQGVAAEALHAMDYQTYAHLQMAQDRAARDVLDRLPTAVKAFEPAAAAGGAAPPMAGFYAIAAIPARYALERGAWEEAAQLRVPSNGTPFTIAIAHFARALGAVRSGRASAASEDVARLGALRDQLSRAGRLLGRAGRHSSARGRRVDGLRARAKGRGYRGDATAADVEDATDKSAVTPGPLAPARELLGEMLLEAGEPVEALQAFEASIAKEPGRFRGAYGAARAAEAAGDPADARLYYEKTLEIAREADTSRPELVAARGFVGN